MPQCKALKTFNSQLYGFIRAGSRFSSEPGYARELAAKAMIEILPDALEPERVQAIPGAPFEKKEPSPPQFPAADPPPAAGEARPSRLSRAAQALTRRTAITSKRGAKP